MTKVVKLKQFQNLLSDPSQAISIPISFISLALASTKLFYSQRIGCLSVLDPSPAMIAPVFLCALLMLLGPLFCLLIFICYFPIASLLPVVIIIFTQYLASKLVYFTCDSKKKILEHFYQGTNDEGSAECDLILTISAATSWIAPFTVWINRKLPGRQGHLPTSTFVTVSAYLLILGYVYFTAPSLTFSPNKYTPIFYCFNGTEDFTNISFHFSENTSFWNIITFRGENSLPKIRICSDEEDPSLWLGNLIKVGICLCVLTQITSFILFWMSDFSTLHKFLGSSKTFRCYIVETLSKTKRFSEIQGSHEEALMLKQLDKKDGFIRSAHFALWLLVSKSKLSDENLTYVRRIRGKLKQEPIMAKVWKCEAKSGRDGSETRMECPPLHAALFNCNFALFVLLCLLGGKVFRSNGLKRKPMFWLWLMSKLGPIQCYGGKFWGSRKMGRIYNKYITKAVKSILSDNRYLMTSDVKADSLKRQLDIGYDPNLCDHEGKRPLHVVAAEGATECLKVLIETLTEAKRTRIHNNDDDDEWNGEKVFLKILMENLADMRARDKVEDVERNSASDYLKILIDEEGGANPTDNTPINSDDMQCKAEFLKSLMQTGINVKDNSGQTPLHDAAKKGANDCLKILIENEANVNAKDIIGVTPLHAAARNGNAECLEILIENSASVDAKDNNGQTPLHEASKKGATDCLKILIKKLADVNAKDNCGETPLHVTALNGNDETLNILIENLADVNARNNIEETPLHLAATAGGNVCLEILLQNHAVVNAKDSQGETALHAAARLGNAECVKALIENGVDVEIRNSHGERSYDVAVHGWNALEQSSHFSDEEKNSKLEDFKRISNMLCKH